MMSLASTLAVSAIPLPTTSAARRRALLAGLAGLAALALAGCTASEEAAAVTREGRGAAGGGQAIVLSGPGATARVSRRAPRGRAEVLHGETEIAARNGAPAVFIVEDVTLEPGGALVTADVAVTGGPEETRIRMDARRGLVTLTSAAGTTELRAPTDAPWVYEPPVGERDAWATPVSAWVALRATSSAPWVRRIQADRLEGWLMPRDQIAVRTDGGTTVVIGADGADADKVFIKEIRLAERGVTMVRTPAAFGLVL